MSCLGVLFAIEGSDEEKLLALKSDDERAAFVQEDVEERFFAAKDGFACETDKAWDAIHRCFDEGKLTYDASTPLRMTILGGTPLYELEDYIIVYKGARDVHDIAMALAGVSPANMRALYDAIDPDLFAFPKGDDDWQYTWHWFERAREFYKRAAAANRAVIFTADQ